MAVQPDLFENVTDRPLEYKDEAGGFWRTGTGVSFDRGKGVVVITNALGKQVKVPMEKVRAL